MCQKATKTCVPEARRVDEQSRNSSAWGINRDVSGTMESETYGYEWGKIKGTDAIAAGSSSSTRLSKYSRVCRRSGYKRPFDTLASKFTELWTLMLAIIHKVQHQHDATRLSRSPLGCNRRINLWHYPWAIHRRLPLDVFILLPFYSRWTIFLSQACTLGWFKKTRFLNITLRTL